MPPCRCTYRVPEQPRTLQLLFGNIAYDRDTIDESPRQAFSLELVSVQVEQTSARLCSVRFDRCVWCLLSSVFCGVSSVWCLLSVF